MDPNEGPPSKKRKMMKEETFKPKPIIQVNERIFSHFLCYIRNSILCRLIQKIHFSFFVDLDSFATKFSI
jgi:hypothetical protein